MDVEDTTGYLTLEEALKIRSGDPNFELDSFPKEHKIKMLISFRERGKTQTKNKLSVTKTMESQRTSLPRDIALKLAKQIWAKNVVYQQQQMQQRQLELQQQQLALQNQSQLLNMNTTAIQNWEDDTEDDD